VGRPIVTNEILCVRGGDALFPNDFGGLLLFLEIMLLLTLVAYNSTTVPPRLIRIHTLRLTSQTQWSACFSDDLSARARSRVLVLLNLISALDSSTATRLLAHPHSGLRLQHN